jgi:hypothetical protein
VITTAASDLVAEGRSRRYLFQRRVIGKPPPANSRRQGAAPLSKSQAGMGLEERWVGHRCRGIAERLSPIFSHDQPSDNRAATDAPDPPGMARLCHDQGNGSEPAIFPLWSTAISPDCFDTLDFELAKERALIAPIVGFRRTSPLQPCPFRRFGIERRPIAATALCRLGQLYHRGASLPRWTLSRTCREGPRVPVC